MFGGSHAARPRERQPPPDDDGRFGSVSRQSQLPKIHFADSKGATVKSVSGPGSRMGKAIILIRVLVGWVFVSEGIQKFLFPAQLGIGRFAKIGIPSPQIMAPFVGAVEIIFGCLVILGLFTRLATIPLLCVIGTAIATTKIPMLHTHGGACCTRRARISACCWDCCFC